jgi:polyhydroxyalkanoate synthesis regulator phasin
MDDRLKKLIYSGIGIASLSRRAKFLLDKLEIEGKLSEEEGKRIVDEITAELKGEGAQLKDDLYGFLEQTLSEFETPTRRELNELKARIEKLETLLKGLGHDL